MEVDLGTGSVIVLNVYNVYVCKMSVSKLGFWKALCVGWQYWLTIVCIVIVVFFTTRVQMSISACEVTFAVTVILYKPSGYDCGGVTVVSSGVEVGPMELFS